MEARTFTTLAEAAAWAESKGYPFKWIKSSTRGGKERFRVGPPPKKKTNPAQGALALGESPKTKKAKHHKAAKKHVKATSDGELLRAQRYGQVQAERGSTLQNALLEYESYIQRKVRPVERKYLSVAFRKFAKLRRAKRETPAAFEAAKASMKAKGKYGMPFERALLSTEDIYSNSVFPASKVPELRAEWTAGLKAAPVRELAISVLGVSHVQALARQGYAFELDPPGRGETDAVKKALRISRGTQAELRFRSIRIVKKKKTKKR